MNVLLVIDVQNDFCPGGSLAVKDGSKIVPYINSLIDSKKFDLIIGTQDWHPAGHISFGSTHKKDPFEVINVSYGKQILWPDHCVQGTYGAEFHPDLHTNSFNYILRKGTNKEIDSYSAFVENDRKTSTRLHLLMSSYDSLYIVGIATDVCVLNTVLDCKGFNTHVLLRGCAGVNNDTTHDAIEEMKALGVGISE